MSWEAWGTPEYIDYPCQVCGRHPDKCECPECPDCGWVGDPDCYRNHGLKPEGDDAEAMAEARTNREGVATEDEEVGAG